MTIDKFQGEYEWLSNFHPVEVKLGGEKYPSVEHAYQAAKTNDPEERREIQLLKKASLAKSKGKKVTMRKDWEKVKLTVMENLLKQKFEDPELRAQLLATGTEELVEGNWWGDRFWGVCKGEGSNHLGRLLMNIRTELQKET